MLNTTPLALTISALLTTAAAASPIGQPGPGPDYGFHWATIGDPGNRDVSAEELAAWGPHPNLSSFTGGGVDHAYRISKYETTTAQWFEFVQAAWPVIGSIPFERDRLAGATLAFSGGQWFMFGDPLRPAAPHWTWAARYCNWLHNGKGSDPSSWETGVYDASTFFVDANGVPQHDLTRAPDAKFFLPTLDEWKKAGHWDPNKNNGEGGYWLYPHGSDEPPVPGHPDDGGETSAALFPPFTDLQKIGMYPDVQSPWGLLDMSGGVSENTEDMFMWGSGLRTRTAGSRWGSAPWDDRFDSSMLGIRHDSIFNSGQGFRLAGIVPANGSAAVFVAGCLFVSQRRRSARR